jgi:penicillin-binding protein 2
MDLAPTIRDPILAGLRGVIAGADGTALNAFSGFSAMAVAGKTGTAQVLGKQDTAVFVAIAPVQAPRYVVSVFMEEAGFGGETAAPVARRILSGLAGQPPGPITLGQSID